MELIDKYNRKISYLRISITDRCNLKCIYCRPRSKLGWLNKQEILTYEEIINISKYVISELGIKKIRLTGGEPLLRRNVINLIENLANLPVDLSLTTNGTLLAKYAKDLKKVGLSKINISLDTLNPSKYRYITGNDELKEVIKGIQEAEDAGLSPIKLNFVVMKNINDDEIDSFIRLIQTNNYWVRFIEFMPSGSKFFIPNWEIFNKINLHYKLTPIIISEKDNNSGPAKYYKINKTKGIIGFISPMSDANFCKACNRLRITAEGNIKPCLFSNNSSNINIKQPAKYYQKELIKELFIKATLNKPKKMNNLINKKSYNMMKIGG